MKTPRFRRALTLEALEERAMFALTVPIPRSSVDLMGEVVEATNAADWGDTIQVQSQVRRSGNAAAGGFYVGWFLSRDATGSADDIALSRVGGGTAQYHAAIGTGVSVGPSFTVDLQLPAERPSGFSGNRYYIVVKTDLFNSVSESNESNNFGQRGEFFDRDAIEITSPGSVFDSVDLYDAAGDSTRDVAFDDGALHFKFDSHYTWPSQKVRLEHIGRGAAVTSLGTFTFMSDGEKVINLDGLTQLRDGENQFRARLDVMPGISGYSEVFTIDVHSTVTTKGTFAGETFSYTAAQGEAAVFLGRGGTDTLQLNVAHSAVEEFNGESRGTFRDFDRLAGPAVYQGSAYDYITLNDGREIYLQGIERLQYADGSIEQLSVLPDDTYFADQWNLHVTDVPSAWRYTTGSDRVLLVSLDSGIVDTDFDGHSFPGFPDYLPKAQPVTDLLSSRLRTDEFSEDTLANPGHGQMAMSVMASAANNAYGVAGINWNSKVFVRNVYNESNGGASLQSAIEDALAYAREHDLKVVFQGGIQGEYWLNAGGTQAELEELMRDNEDIALFAVAAGNGGTDINIDDPDDPDVLAGLSGGVARLQSSHANVMSVGALSANKTFVNGLTNATSVYRASYSNYGPALTLMAPTDSPAMRFNGTKATFNGTSAANPNMAALASLVWSVNPDLTGNEIREILIGTAMDIGLSGRDDETGSGLVNVDAAVRRALALARSPDVAGLYPNYPEVGLISQTASSPRAPVYGPIVHPVVTEASPVSLDRFVDDGRELVFARIAKDASQSSPTQIRVLEQPAAHFTEALQITNRSAPRYERPSLTAVDLAMVGLDDLWVESMSPAWPAKLA